MREVPVKTNKLYISDDGHSFADEENCRKYEELLNKYHHPLKPLYRSVKDGEGHKKHCYYVKSFEEAQALLHLVSIKHGFRGRLCPKCRYDGTWLVFSENEDYLPAETIDEYIETQRETELSYRQAVSDATNVLFDIPE